MLSIHGNSYDIVKTHPINRGRAPITTVPVELLAEVFIFCLPLMSTLSRRDAPLALMGVCQHWREIAKETTKLWTTLSLADPFSGVPSYRTIDVPLKYWAERAKHRSLSLSYMPSAGNTPLNTQPGYNLLPFLPNLRYLGLRLPHRQYELIAAALPTSLSGLERIKFVMTRRGLFTSNHRAIDLGSNTCLRSINVETEDSGLGFISGGLLINIPFGQLTKLTIKEESLHPAGARALIIQCLNLVECRLNISQYSPDALIPPAHNHATLLHLTILEIEFTGLALRGCIYLLLEPLILPALKTLRILAESHCSSRLANDLVELQQRSQFPLKHFTLFNISVSRSILYDFLCAIPTLQTLILQSAPGNFHNYRKILSKLSYVPATTMNVLPRLEVLHISDNVDGRHSHESGHAKHLPKCLSVQLGDYVAINTIATRFWKSGSYPHTQSRLMPLKIVTVEWQNVPIEWLRESRRVKACADALQKQGLQIEMPLRSRRPQ